MRGSEPIGVKLSTPTLPEALNRTRSMAAWSRCGSDVNCCSAPMPTPVRITAIRSPGSFPGRQTCGAPGEPARCCRTTSQGRLPPAPWYVESAQSSGRRAAERPSFCQVAPLQPEQARPRGGPRGKRIVMACARPSEELRIPMPASRLPFAMLVRHHRIDLNQVDVDADYGVGWRGGAGLRKRMPKARSKLRPGDHAMN